MDIKEAQEILRADLAWANWTEEQQEAIRVAYKSMSDIENLKEKNKRLNQIIGKYAGKMSDIAVFNDEVSKEIRKVSNELITL